MKPKHTYPKTWLLPPESGPTPQGLNINYNTVKTVKLGENKKWQTNRQVTDQRVRRELNLPGEEEIQEAIS